MIITWQNTINITFAVAAGIRHQNKHATKSSCATELKWECSWRRQDIRAQAAVHETTRISIKGHSQ